MSTIDLLAANGQSIQLAGSPYEMTDAVSFYGFGFSENADWYTIGDSKANVDERAAADGAFGILRDWRPSLPVTVKGWYRGPDRASVRAARRQLARVLGYGKNVRMTFTDEDEKTSRGLSIRNVEPDNVSGLYFRFTFHGVALDPSAYGEPRVYVAGVGVSGGGLLFPLGTTPSAYWDFGADGSTNRITVTNNGTADTYPDLVVTGGLSGGFIITDQTSGRTIRFARTLNIGDSVRINQRTGTATINGTTDASGSLTSYGFFYVGPGETHVIQFTPIGSPSGTPRLTLTIEDGYR